MEKDRIKAVYDTIRAFHLKSSILMVSLLTVFLFIPVLTFLVEFYRPGSLPWAILGFAVTGMLLGFTTTLLRTGNTVVGVYWLSSALDTYMNTYDFDFAMGLVQRVPEKHLRDFFESVFKTMAKPFQEMSVKARAIFERIEAVKMRFAELSGSEGRYIETVKKLLELNKPLKEAIDSLVYSIQNLHSLVVSQQQSMRERKSEIEELLKSMETVSELSKKIEEVAAFIEQVSRRTNLLALNASIEAARGEEEVRFARVASEIRNLANQIQIQVRSINESLAFLNEFLKTSFSTGNILSSSLEEISADVSSMVDYSQDILSRTFSLGGYGKAFSNEIEKFQKTHEEVVGVREEISSLLDRFEEVVKDLKEILSPRFHTSPFQISSSEREAKKLKLTYIAFTSFRALLMGALMGIFYFFLRRYVFRSVFWTPAFIFFMANISAIIVSEINWKKHVKPLVDFVLGLLEGKLDEEQETSFIKGVSEWVDDFRKQVRKYKEAAEKWFASISESVGQIKARLSRTLSYFEEQGRNIDRVSQNFNDVLSTLSGTSQKVSEMEALSRRDLEKISDAKTNMEIFLKGVLEMVRQGGNIASNLESIGDVAELTMVLSLNATIESMHSGEKGRGFAVVAQEVRKLASSVQGASEKVLGVVRNIEKVASQLEENGKSARQAFESIESSIGNIMSKVSEIGRTLEVTLEEWERRKDEIEQFPSVVEQKVGGISALLTFFEEFEGSLSEFENVVSSFSV